MPAYGFKPHFVEKTLAGLKPHTIRAPRQDGRVPKVGEAFHAYCGMRTPRCTWLWSSTITRVQWLQIGPEKPDALDGLPFIRTAHALPTDYLRGGPGYFPSHAPILNAEATRQLIHADGFDRIDDFTAHFNLGHGASFTGFLIHWNPADAIACARQHVCPDCGAPLRWQDRAFHCTERESSTVRSGRWLRSSATAAGRSRGSSRWRSVETGAGAGVDELRTNRTRHLRK